MKIIKHLKAALILSLTLVGWGGQTAFCQTQVAAVSQMPPNQSDWLTADLRLDNRPFAKTRAALDTRIAAGEKPASLEKQYRLQGNDIYDARKIFRWAYVAYKENKVKPDQNFLPKVNSALDYNQRPGAYDWVRLRFLVSSLQYSMFRPNAELIKVGRRLLNVKYDDEEVMYFFIKNTQASQSLKERKIGLSLARNIAQQKPRDGYWQWLVANSVRSIVNFESPFASYKGNEWALAEYKKALRLLPPSEPSRKVLIELIVWRELLYDSNGKRGNASPEAVAKALQTTSLR